MEIQTLSRGPAAQLLIAALIALASIVPFVILEVINRRRFGEPFPFVLFCTLWVLTSAFVVVSTPIARSFLGGRKLAIGPVGLVMRIAALALIALTWGNIVMDQMPCFLGVPNCD